jgi:ArsR family transcriptional regulator, arsenate/arsenite/antimonite-responsive transcriptional repressor
MMCQYQFPALDMAKTTQTEVLGSADLMFRAFSDRTRLRILHVLLGGELCVGDIVEILQAP